MKTITSKASKEGFTLIELLIVIAIIGILASVAMPAYNGIRQSGYLSKDVNNVRQIGIGCRVFSSDWEGLYPTFDPEDDGEGEESTFTTSVDAFNVLIPDYIDTESIFWIQTKDKEKIRPPKEDGLLEIKECVYGYVTAQTDSSYTNSPLVFDGLMTAPGVMGEFHPWLNKKKCVVGFCDGHVEESRLSSTKAGATVVSKDRRILNIFEEREVDENGTPSGGQLSTTKDNVLLPQ